MSNHPINLDAIQEGVTAFLATYPDEKALDGRVPTKAPKGAHAVLWIDDFWRGVDMAREALESAELRGDSPSHGATQVSMMALRQVACSAARYAIDHMGELPDTSDMADPAINRDAVAVFAEKVAMISLYSGAQGPWVAGVNLTSRDGRWVLLRQIDPEDLADLCEPA